MLNQLCTWTAKTRAIPSLHRDSFLAKVPGLYPVLASGNATSLYCRAVICKVVPNTMISNAQARVWQLATATAFAAAKHMLFCLPGLHRQNN